MSQPKPDPISLAQEDQQSFVLRHFMPFKVTVLSNKLSRIIAKTYSEKFGVTIPEWRVLALLSQHQEISAQMVVDETPLDKVAVSRAVAGLVEKGQVVKSVSEVDKRVTVLSLTISGRTITQEIQKLALSYERDAMSVLSAKEAKTFHEYLDRLITRADDIVKP